MTERKKEETYSNGIVIIIIILLLIVIITSNQQVHPHTLELIRCYLSDTSNSCNQVLMVVLKHKITVRVDFRAEIVLDHKAKFL